MSTFVPYFNEVEVEGLGEGTGNWEIVDLALFLKDPSAKAVILRAAYGSGLTPFSIGFRGINDEQLETVVLDGNTKYITACVSLAGGTTIQAKWRTQATPRIWISGEVHDHVEIYDTAVFYRTTEAELDDFIDRQPTPQGDDELSDISAVIVRAIISGSDFANFAIRERGSMLLPTPSAGVSATFWYVVGVDENGFYQTYTDGKNGFEFPYTLFYEVGYILKTGSVVTLLSPVDREPDVSNPDFAVLDLSAIVVDEGATVVGIEWYNENTGRQAIAKAVGSGAIAKQQITEFVPATQFVLLDDSRQIEYRMRDSDTLMSIWWWELLVPDAKGSVDFESLILPAVVMVAEILKVVSMKSEILEMVSMTPELLPVVNMGAEILETVSMNAEIV